MQNYGMRLEAAILAASAAMLLGACAQLEWVKPGAGPGEFERDLALCRREAWLRAREFSWWHDPFGPLVMHDREGRPVLVQPYWPFHDPFFVEGRLELYCMEDKGYRLVPVEPVKPAPTIQPSQPEKPAGSP
jgi:hypothetical protein